MFRGADEPSAPSRSAETVSTVCLCMIVKNEAPTIRRCLESVKPVIDRWVVVDTGSEDGTQEAVRSFLRDVPGELFERPWQDFATNRSEALALARNRADYSLVIDADDKLEIAPDFRKTGFTAAAYNLEITDEGTQYWRPSLVSNRLPWRYAGVLHEYLTCDESSDQQPLVGLRIRRNHDGARRRDPQTYRKDAALLAEALRHETDLMMRARYVFYLAQSYRDGGDLAAALEAYLARSKLGHWQEEVFFSLYQAARLKELLAFPEDSVLGTYRSASAAGSDRAEAWHGASRYCREKGRFREGYDFAKSGLALKMPGQALFVEPWIYAYGLLDELSIHAYWTGRYNESLDACLAMLETDVLPADQRSRVAANARFAVDKLHQT